MRFKLKQSRKPHHYPACPAGTCAGCDQAAKLETEERMLRAWAAFYTNRIRQAA